MLQPSTIKAIYSFKELIEFFISEGYFSIEESEVLERKIKRIERDLSKEMVSHSLCPNGGNTHDDCRMCEHSKEFHYDRASNACISRL